MKTKVTAAVSPFNPIDLTITFESRKEVEMFWCFFNMRLDAIAASNKEYLNDFLSLTEEELRGTNFHFKLFDVIASIVGGFPPHKKEST